MGHPERMGLAHGWSEARFIARSRTTTPHGRAATRTCASAATASTRRCSAPVLEAARERRRVARGGAALPTRRTIPLVIADR